MNDIVDRLLPDIADLLECDADDDLRTAVMQSAEAARAAAQCWRRFDPRVVRKAARNLVKALAAMDAAYGAADNFGLSGVPERLVSEYEAMRMRTEPLRNIHGPDPRFDVLHWQCADQAYTLIKRYARRPVQRLGGNMHTITQWLVEIATDEAQRAPSGDNAWLLKVVQKVHRSRKREGDCPPGS
jgi:hypothetical protein